MATSDANEPVILVTGATGLLGTSICADLARDHRVVGLDLHRPERDPGLSAWLYCDLTEDASVARALDEVRSRFGTRLRSVVHLAAYYDFSGEPSPLYQALTVQGTARLLRALRRFELEQFVFSSSLLVMKPADEGELLDEESPVEAEWDYPRSKLEAEEAIRRERGDLPCVILRIGGVYDEGCHSIPLAQHIRRIREKSFDSFFFPGNPSHGQAFVHKDDLVGLVRRVVEERRSLAPYDVFLVAEPDAMSYGELQDRLGELLHGREWPTIRIPAPVAKAGAWLKEKTSGEDETFIRPWMVDLADAHYPVDPSKARRSLGWEPRNRLRASLPGMVQRLQRDPRRWYEEHDLSFPEKDRAESEPAAGRQGPHASGAARER